MALRRNYSEDDRAVALAAYAANESNLDRTAKFTGIPRNTIRNWVNGGAINADTIQLSTVKKGLLADRLETVAHLLVDCIPDKIAEASLQMVATSLGIAVDKMQLLRNKPTTITDDLSSLSDAELDKRIAAIERGETAKAPKSAPPA